MAKDRAAPFSRKHKKIWLPITGGMILIGTINLTIGYYLYSHGPKDAPHPPAPPPIDGAGAGLATKEPGAPKATSPIDAGPADAPANAPTPR